MKKILAVLLCIGLLLPCLSFSAFAGTDEKISSALQKRMETMSEDEKIEVWLFTDNLDGFNSSYELRDYVNHQARQEILDTYGVDEGGRILQMRTTEDADVFWTAYNRILFELEEKNNRAAVEKLDLAEEDIVYLGCSMILNLTKTQILSAAALDEVLGIGCDSSTEPYEPLETDIGPGAFDELIKEEKVLPDLKVKLAGSTPEDILSVYIAFKGAHKRVDDMPSWPDKEEAHREYSAYIKAKNEAHFAEVFNGLDVEIRCDVFGNAVIANVRACDIKTIIGYDIVQDIDYCPNLEQIPDEGDRRDMILSQISKQYGSMDIDLSYFEQLTDSLYIVRFTVGDYSTDRPIIISKVRDFILRTDDGLPEAMILDTAENKICSFSQAYDEHLLTDDLLQKLSQSEMIDLFELRRGDADMDGSTSVMDATAIQKFKVSLLSADKISERAADTDADGTVSVLDATRIQKHLAGICTIDGADLLKVSAVFEGTSENVWSYPHVTATATGGYGPYQYCYKIKGGFDAYSSYGNNFGEYSIDMTDQMPGAMNFTTGWVDRNVTEIPSRSLTYGDTFTLIIKVKDSSGAVSEPVCLGFTNLDIPRCVVN